MTPTLLLPLHNALIGAQLHSDPLLWDEALRRFDMFDQALQELPGEVRVDLEERVFRMLPSDWPLWRECCRRPAIDRKGEPILH